MRKVTRVLLAAATVLSAMAAATGAGAQVTYSGSATGPNSGAVYTTFDGNALGNTGQTTSTGIGVSFTGSGGFRQGSVTGQYAAPIVYGGLGANFGGQANGPDTTTYVSSGIGSATLTFSAPQSYLGMLLGSVDTYNTLSFFSGSTLIQAITGSQILAAPGASNGINGSLYVNFTSSAAFDRVVATSTINAFEFDDLATRVASAVPEAATWAMMMAGLGVVGGSLRRRRAAAPRVGLA